MRSFSGILAGFCMALLFSFMANPCASAGGKCYAKDDNFSVTEPYLINKACFLFYHGINVPLRTQSDLIISRPEQLHSDPLQAEFYQLILDGKILPIKKNTQLFSCKYDLHVVARDFKLNRNRGGEGRILGYEYPEFNCYGRVSKFVQVRIKNRSQCRWVAIETIACDE